MFEYVYTTLWCQISQFATHSGSKDRMYKDGKSICSAGSKLVRMTKRF